MKAQILINNYRNQLNRTAQKKIQFTSLNKVDTGINLLFLYEYINSVILYNEIKCCVNRLFNTILVLFLPFFTKNFIISAGFNNSGGKAVIKK